MAAKKAAVKTANVVTDAVPAFGIVPVEQFRVEFETIETIISSDSNNNFQQTCKSEMSIFVSAKTIDQVYAVIPQLEQQALATFKNPDAMQVKFSGLVRLSSHTTAVMVIAN